MSPFKTKMDDKEIASATNIKKIMEQNNYINMILKTLEDQLNKVEEVIQYQKHIKTTFIEKYDKLLFKPFELSKKFQENPILD